jgi:hypothetical protein
MARPHAVLHAAIAPRFRGGLDCFWTRCRGSTFDAATGHYLSNVIVYATEVKR